MNAPAVTWNTQEALAPQALSERLDVTQAAILRRGLRLCELIQSHPDDGYPVVRFFSRSGAEPPGEPVVGLAADE